MMLGNAKVLTYLVRSPSSILKTSKTVSKYINYWLTVEFVFNNKSRKDRPGISMSNYTNENWNKNITCSDTDKSKSSLFCWFCPGLLCWFSLAASWSAVKTGSGCARGAPFSIRGSDLWVEGIWKTGEWLRNPKLLLINTNILSLIYIYNSITQRIL